MPRKGYRSLTLPEDVYRRIAKRARLYGTSCQKMIELILENDAFDGTFSYRTGGKVPSNPFRPAIL
jgi:hypothetical protein